MTSAQIRQSFLDFFAKQGHTITPSSSLMPDSPGLLFTNAGMNQFVPIFLGERAPDVASWAGVKPALNTRAADTQKCIRAGGKHNDLEDVGFDTYHHTMFEMLGNWSFGDYFKKESLQWGWELITKVWGIPAKRLFATVYSPDKSKNDPSEFDQEAYNIWADIFRKEGLDPAIHIVNGNKKDNFWMMGDTGPCGPCSEIHFNLLPSDDEVEGRKLVNSSSSRCIEIWNHVFIQFNAAPASPEDEAKMRAGGKAGEDWKQTFAPLAAKHVDTGMGFERVAGIHAVTNGFKTFDKDPSNYAADVFAPLFKKITELSGKSYTALVPESRQGLSEQQRIDIAFRVLADHARCVSCAIADGIIPDNKGRNSVIRKILRRGVLYGHRHLGLTRTFFHELVAAVVESLGSVFPELAQQQTIIERTIRSEEDSFRRTLDRGLQLFTTRSVGATTISGPLAFELHATYGFPLEMTQLLATEKGIEVDVPGYEAEVKKHKEVSDQGEQTLVKAATEGDAAIDHKPTTFTGYTITPTMIAGHASVVDIVKADKDVFLVFDQTPFYAEMGGQAGDTGTALVGGQLLHIVDTTKDKSGRHLHKLGNGSEANVTAKVGDKAELALDLVRRRAISRHHSAAHLIHWALRKVLGTHVRQAGTSKTPERMRFDFSHFEAVTHAQLLEVEQLVNEKVIDNARVDSYETEFDKKPEGTLAFFGDKYGKFVRVVDIGGYSRELCGGTHVATTGEIGLIKIVAEMAIAAGTRRIEAVAGQPALDLVVSREAALAAVSAHLGGGASDVVKKLEALLAAQKETEKQLKVFQQKALAGLADELAAKAATRDGLKFVSAVVNVSDQEALRSLGSQVLAKLGEGVVQLGAALGDKASLVAFCSPAAIKAGHQAGKIIQGLSTQIGGKGGGKPDFAMGGGKDVAKLAEVIK